MSRTVAGSPSPSQLRKLLRNAVLPAVPGASTRRVRPGSARYRMASLIRRRRAFRLDDMQGTAGLFPPLGLDTAAADPVTGFTVILTGHTQHPPDVFDVSELSPGGLSVVPVDLPEAGR